MFGSWIKVENAVPPFTSFTVNDCCPEDGNLLESNEVICLLKDGDIVSAKYTMFTINPKATFMDDDRDLEDEVIAWIPKSELYPLWFTSSKEVKRIVEAIEEGWDNGTDE